MDLKPLTSSLPRRPEYSPLPQQPGFDEQCLTRIFHSIPAIIAISKCLDSTYVEVNPAFVKALGHAREDVLGRRAVDLGVWSRPEQRDEIVSAVQRGEPVQEIECDLRSKTGHSITVLTSVQPIQWNGVPCLLFCSGDIPSLERAHEERQKFVSLIRNSQDFIATADLEGKLTYLNPAGRRMIGIGESDPIESINISDYLHEPWRAFHAETVIPTVLKSGAWGGEMQFRNLRTQELIDVWRSIFLILDPRTEEPLCFASVTHNITERKRAEERIRQLNLSLERRVAERTAELESLNRELEAFAYSVSHDLRAPLHHIHGYIELLARATEGQRTEKASRYLRTIAEASEEMARLIDDLLDFSRTGRVELLQSPVDLDELAREVSTRFVPPSFEREIRWNIHSETCALGDPTLIRQVLANLFDNAIKYSRTRAVSEVEFGSSAPEGDHATLFVRDNGVGFDMQYVHKLFGVFERLHSASEFEGTGIGLATVRRIVTRHGGRTWAEGRVDHGATIYFTLRRAKSLQESMSTISQP